MLRATVITSLLCCLARPSSAAEVDWSVKLGEEVDTNPARTVGERSDSDLATRLFTDVSVGGWAGDRWALQGSAQAGARAFVATHEQDMLALQAGGSAAYWPTYTLWFGARGSWKDRRERGGFRDYGRTSLVGEAGLAYDGFDVTVAAGYGWFTYRPDADLSAAGPTGSLRLVGRPSRRWTLSAWYSPSLRQMDEQRYFWDGDASAVRLDDADSRVDVLHAAGTQLRYGHHRVVAELGYTLLRNESNSRLRSYTRHAVSPSVTFVPAGELVIRVAATLQRTRWDDGALADATTALDDENRNALAVTLEHPMGPEWLSAEARYARYAEAFSGDDRLRFDRTVVYLGLVASPAD